MKLKLLIGLLAFLLLMGSALAYTEWGSPYTMAEQSTDANSYLARVYPLPSNTIVDNCTLAVGTHFEPLTDTAGNIWIIDDGTIEVYDKDCNLEHQILVNGTSFGQGWIYNYDGDGEPNILFPVKTGDSTMSIQGFEFQGGTTIVNDKNIDLGSTSSCSSIWCDEDIDYCAVYCDDGNIKKIDISAGTYTDTSSSIGVYKYDGWIAGRNDWQQNFDASPIVPTVTGGDVDGDGHEEILFWNIPDISSNANFVEMALYDITDNVVQSNYTGFADTRWGYSYGGGGCGSRTASFYGSPAIISRIGAPTSLPKIFFAITGIGGGLSCISYGNAHIWDANWNELHDIVSSANHGTSSDFQNSNWVIGDLDNDNSYEYCLMLDHYVNGGNFTCYEATYTQEYEFFINLTGWSNSPISIAGIDYEEGLDLEFATPLGIMDYNGDVVYDLGLPVNSDGVFVQADVNNNNRLDLIYMDGSSGTIYLSQTGTPAEVPTGCEALNCDYPCIAYDDFAYDCALDEMGWTLYPDNPTLTPTSGRMCYDPTPSGVHYSQWLLDAYADEQIITTEFDMQVDDGVTPIHEFVWYDGTDDDYKTTYYIWWEYYAGNTTLYAHDSGGSSYVVCTNCWNLGEEHHYEIRQFHQNTDGEVFYNETSGQLEPIDANTFYIVIDDNSSKSYYNLANKEPLNHSHSNLLNDATFRWYNENVCVDNFQVYAGTVFSTGEFTAECEYNPHSYTYPVLWADYFQYNDDITNHPYWSGYPLVIGDNPYGTCDILFYDPDLYTGIIETDFPSPMYDDFRFRWSFGGHSPINETSYYLCGSPTRFFMWDDQDNLCLFLSYNQANDGEKCNITSYGNYTFDEVGYWDEGGAVWDYKLEVNLSSKTFDFYYTTLSSPFTYIQGCDDCTMYNDTCDNIETVGWQTWTPVTAENQGFWLDTLSMENIEFIVVTNQTNFCYFDGCIYHDHFDYDDAVENHGWYFWNNTPVDSIVTIDANPYGYYFDHDFDIFRSNDHDGIVTVQTRMMVAEHDPTAVNKPDFVVWSGDLQNRPLSISFDSGTIYDVGTTPFIALGTYVPDQWYVFTWVIDLTTQTYDMYVDSSKVADDQSMRDGATSIGSVGWHTIDNEIQVDYITVSVGSELADDTIGTYEDTGVPSSHLRECWDEGEFDWSCCTAQEEAERKWGCVYRVTFFYWIGSLTNFILTYILYFIVLAIIFVLITPYIIPALRRRR